MTPILKRFAQGAMWNTIASILSRSLNLISIILVARILGKSGFGEFALIQSTLATFYIIISSTLTVTTTKHLAEHKNHNKSKANRSLALCLGSAITFGGLASFLTGFYSDWICSTIFETPEIANSVKLASILIFTNSLNSAMQGILSGLERFQIIAKQNLLFGILSIFLLPFFAAKYGLQGAIVGQIGTSLAQLAISSRFSYKSLKAANIKPDWKGIRTEASTYWKFSLPHFSSSVVYSSTIWLGYAILSREKNGITEIAIFAIGYKWRELILFIPGSISSVALAMYSERKSSNDANSSKIIMRSYLMFNCISGILILMPLAISSSFIIDQYGHDFSDVSSIPFLITIFSAFIITLINPYQNYLVSHNKTWPNLYLTCLWAVSFLVTVKLVEPTLSSTGLAITHLTSASVLFIGHLTLHIKFSRNDKSK